MEQQVVAGRVDVTRGMRDQGRDAPAGKMNTDSLVVPQAVRAQTLQPQPEGQQKDGDQQPVPPG